MAKVLTPIPNTSFSMIDLVALVNTIVGVIGTEVLTANTSANGALTSGNVYISGILGASVGVFGSFRGGSIAVPDVAVAVSNVFITNGSQISIGNTTANATMNATSLVIKDIASNTATIARFNQGNIAFQNTTITDLSFQTSGISGQVIDSFGLGIFRSAEYLIQVTDNTANGYQVSKILLVHNGVTPMTTEYGQLFSNNVLASFTASANATSCILTAVPVSTNTTIRISRTTLSV